MIKIAHEAPFCIQNQVSKETDYDYALVHLFETHPIYYEYFRAAIERGREVILDNSIFELGKSFEEERFAYWIEKLSPTYYIIPDVLEDYKKTIENLYSWVHKKESLPGKRIGVVQGKTYKELVRCYQEVDRVCDVIAISFDYSFYEKIYPSSNKYFSYYIGRYMFIGKLLNDRIINVNKSHHLLGVSLPQELFCYRDSRYSFIKSVDTSNPIVHGILKKAYSPLGLFNKESIKLVDLIDWEYDKNVYFDYILFNIRQFKKIANER